MIKLKSAFENMMNKAGVNEFEKDDMSGPTQVVNVIAHLWMLIVPYLTNYVYAHGEPFYCQI